MNRCHWCDNKAKVKETPLRYICEYSAYGHDRNTVRLVSGILAFSATEQEARELWNRETSKVVMCCEKVR